jgi:hypothetical protein
MDRDHRKALIDSALDRQAIGPLDRDQLDRERDQSRAQRADATLVVAIAAALDDPCWPSARASLRGALPVCAGTRED